MHDFNPPRLRSADRGTDHEGGKSAPNAERRADPSAHQHVAGNESRADPGLYDRRRIHRRESGALTHVRTGGSEGTSGNRLNPSASPMCKGIANFGRRFRALARGGTAHGSEAQGESAGQGG